jgi:phosphate starvation-inducible PhoH-like protein
MKDRIAFRFKDNDILREILGPNDRHLDLLKELTGAKMFLKDGELIAKTDENSLEMIDLERLIYTIADIAAHVNNITERDITYVFKQCKDEQACKDIADVYKNKTKIATTKSGKEDIYAKSMNQKHYYKIIQDNDVVFGIGPAGTGKTFIPIVDAAYKLKKNEIKKIILTRPIVEAEENLGFLPGDMKDKVDPYLRPLYDGLEVIFSKEEIVKLIELGRIEIAPIAYMRGRTLENAYIILDEAQNTTKGQMKLFLTRLGFGSKMVITGDITQVDLPRNKKSGLRQAIETLKKVHNVAIMEFEPSDIVRHPIVQNIVENFDNYE